MGVLENLEPKNVFRFFEELSAIPRGSGSTKAVSDRCVRFARERGLEVSRDGLNNVVIVKEASPGYENAETVILQGHLDMVCEKAPDCGKDMACEGLDLAVDGDAIYAKGTTLGGDDGIAVAMALAILDDDSLPHPRLEAVFTTDEEIGMLGAQGLDMSRLRGRRMLNLDSEDEGVFIVGCAGGNRTRCVLPLRRAAFAGETLRVTVTGLIGGHSGGEIHKGRANADLLLGRVLCALGKKTDFRLISAEGGSKDNAIPREAAAVLTAADGGAVRDVCAAFDAAFRAEYRLPDPGARVTACEADAALPPMDADSTARAVCLLTCAPNGIQAMSADIPGLPETSLNLGILTTSAETLEASFCVRSSSASRKQMLVDRLTCLTERLGGHTEITGDYPGWAYRPDSPLRDLAVRVYREQYGREPEVKTIHAGVECGLFSDRLPGLDCVSLGPDMEDIHTCREKLHAASSARVYRMVTEMLRRMK